MSFRKALKRIFLSILVFQIFLVPSLAEAWSQAPHSQINAEALRLFLRQARGEEKFRLGPLAPGAFQERLRGVGVASSSLNVGDFVSREMNLSMQRWIIMGGDWADEPHLFSSVRHFYDPLRIEGVAYLTDQSEVHGLYDSPQIDARSWGLDHPENPFSFFVALSSYKAALEVQEDAPLPPQIGMSHFKTNLNLPAKDHEDQRHLYLSRAYRALGESMHMLADMTQPAHVRNDSHPLDEPIEISTFPEHVRAAAASPFIDSRIRPYLKSAGGTLQEPLELFHQVAIFTNKTFCTMDTIYDALLGVLPNNRQKPYPSPQLFNMDLEVVETTVQGFLMPRTVSKFYGHFDQVKRVPMAQERLSFHWFDPEQSFLGEFDKFKEKAGRGAAGGLGRLGRYHVPHAYAPFQGEVLLSLAIYACADLLELFFPTLELKAEFEESELLPEREPGADPPEDAEEVPITVIEIESSVEHLQKKDPAWKAADLAIHYSGPAELVVLEKEEQEGREKKKEIYTRKLLFRKGALEQIETLEGTLEEAPLRLYAAPSGASLTEEQLFYELKHKQTALIRIEAGSRLFESPSWTLDQEAEVSILPPRILILELREGANQDEIEFEAGATPKGIYLFEWDFDDGTDLVEDRPHPGKRSKVTHLYQGLKPGQEYAPRVKLFDHKENFLAEDAISISVIEGLDRHFFENRTFWTTGSPFANDPSVTFPEVPLKLGLDAAGLSGDILPDTPEAKRLQKMTGAVENAQDAIKEQMLQEMAKMGVTLTDSQLQEALGQALGLSGLGKPGQDPRMVPGRKVLVSGYAVGSKPLILTLSVHLDTVPPVPVSLPETPPLEGRVKVQKWFFTTGFLSSPEISGSSGKASVSWVPGKDAKIPDSFSVDLVMYYSLDFYKRGTQEPWLDSGVPVHYDNLSVSFPVGICFVPLWQDKKP